MRAKLRQFVIAGRKGYHAFTLTKGGKGFFEERDTLLKKSLSIDCSGEGAYLPADAKFLHQQAGGRA